MPSIDETISAVLGGENVARDDEGRMVLGSNTAGCHFCGSISVQPDREGDRVVLWHASLECCEKRILQEISWREDEISFIKRAAAKDLEPARQAEREAEEADWPNQEKAALKRADVARKAADNRWREAHAPAIKRLTDEVKRLQSKLPNAPEPLEARKPYSDT